MKLSWLFLTSMTLICGCALLGENEDPVVKNAEIRYEAPSAPYRKISVTSADVVWQSSKTGNTIAVNSMCQKYADLSLSSLRDNILSGIEDLKIISEKTATFQGRDAQRVLADGNTDGVPVRLDLMIFKKNNCNYDLAYIARRQQFSSEQPIFEKFLVGFRAP